MTRRNEIQIEGETRWKDVLNEVMQLSDMVLSFEAVSSLLWSYMEYGLSFCTYTVHF